MKIDSNYKPSPANTGTKPAAATRVQNQATTPDPVSLSALSGTFSQGVNTPPVNQARIQEIKQAISEGRFQINPDAIADRLIDSAKDLVKHNKNQA